MRATAEETREVGAKTLAELDEQGGKFAKLALPSPGGSVSNI